MHEWKEEMMEEKNELEVLDSGSTKKGVIPSWHPLKVFCAFYVAIATFLCVSPSPWGKCEHAFWT